MIRKLRASGKSIILVGTAHVSKESVKLVRETIKKERPGAVAVELCESRYKVITNKKKWEDTKVTDIIRQGKAHLFLVNVALAGFERRIGSKVGVRPGDEMLEAIRSAEKIKAKLVLADRDIQVTLKRAWASMGTVEKMKVAAGLFAGAFEDEIDEKMIEELKKSDVMTELIEELAHEAPQVKKVLIDERDEYIARKILDSEAKKTVAVVGAGHVEGITRRIKEMSADWKKKKAKSVSAGKKAKGRNVKREANEARDLASGESRARLIALESVPQKKKSAFNLGLLVPLSFLAIIAYGFMKHGAELTATMLWKWTIIHGGLSALGAAIALGHPVSIATAFLAAPITSLNPFLAAGWFAGLAEAKIREPRVRDFKALAEIEGISDFWKNRVTRILLVTAFANLGSMLGTFVALPYMASLI